MKFLDWELSVLSRAVGYANLSAASAHIGISQPQLSRIIARIESELGVVLLDRTVRRQSSWTSSAKKLAILFERTSKAFQTEIETLVKSSRLTQLRMGALEGLLDLAVSYGKRIVEDCGIKTFELDIFDIDELENLFIAGNLDLILTSRELGKRKPKFSRLLGYQNLEHVHKPGKAQVMSHYEFRKLKDPASGVVLSNSLAVRKLWLARFGGSGFLPTEILKKESQGSEKILIFGADRIPEELWKVIEAR